MAYYVVKNIFKSYGKNEVLKGINFDLEKGQVLFECEKSAMGLSRIEKIDIVVYVDPVNYLDAGKAYIIKVDAASTSITATLSGNPTTTAVDANGMLGNLLSTSVNVPADNYIIKNNKIRKVANANVTIGQYKAYITLNNIGETSSPYFIGADDATGIKGLEIENSQNDIFNLQGQRVTNIEKGVYIINGKKVLVK